MIVYPLVISNRISSTNARPAQQLGLSNRLSVDPKKIAFTFRRYTVRVNTAVIPKSEAKLLIMQSSSGLPQLIWHDTLPEILRTEKCTSLDELVRSNQRGKRKKKKARIYVHGFNINPYGQVLRAAYFNCAFKDPDADHYFYDWASFGGLFSNYIKQADTAACSAPGLQALIYMLLEHYDSVDIITDSKGAEVALPALANISKERPDSKIGRLIMDKPDVSRMTYGIFYAESVPLITEDNKIDVLMSDVDLPIMLASALRYEPDRNGNWKDMLRLACPLDPAYFEGTRYRDISKLDKGVLPFGFGHDPDFDYIGDMLEGRDHIDDDLYYKRKRGGKSPIDELKRAKKLW